MEKPKDGRIQYNETRKRETREKLLTGIQRMKSLKKYDGKPITVYALSKYTGVKYETIQKYPDILDKLATVNADKNATPLKTAVVNIKQIQNLDHALAVIETLTDMYNETKDKLNESTKTISALNLQLARSKMECLELRKVVDSMSANSK